MITKRFAAALFLAFVVAGAAFAQSSTEYGRADGGDVGLLFKQPGMWSGSFGLTTTSGSDLGSKGFAGTVGGALLADRIWFFATANRTVTRQPVVALPQMAAPTAAADAKLIDLAAVTGLGRESNGTASSLSLHWTGLVSSSSSFSATVFTRRATAQPALVTFTHW